MSIADTNPSERAYARFLPRLRALCIDAIIVMVSIFAAIALAVAVRSDHLARPLGFSVAAAWLLYEPVLVAFAGGTIGHRRCNLRVVDDHTRGNVSFLKAVLRTLIKAALGWMSFISMLTTRRSQAIHDLLTHSTVQILDLSKAGEHQYVREHNYADPALPSRARRGLVILGYLVVALVAYWLVLFGLMAVAFSNACLNAGRCSRAEDYLVFAVVGAFVVTCAALIGFGWRGRLPGARRGG